MDELLPIGAFSESSGLSVKRLRSYAAAGVLIPAAVDPSTGYRYYAWSQCGQARVIDLLRQAGMPLADVRAFVREPSRQRLQAWAEQLDADLARRHNAIEAARRLVAHQDHSNRPEETHRDQEEALMTTLRTAARTDKGPVREDNQDVVVTNDRVAVVADGMGGLPGGEYAATALTGAVEAAFTGRSADELRAAVRAANWAIWDHAATHEHLQGMGTTVCAAGLLDDGRVAVVHVGDSRAYLWRDRTLTQLTEDHTLTAELVRNGELAADHEPHHDLYGLLTRAVGVAPTVELDSSIFDLAPGDRLLLCTDGLFNEVPDAGIATVMARADDLAAIADELVAMAIGRGGNDNVSVVAAQLVA